MRRHSNPPGALLLLFPLFIWLGMACSKSAKEEDVPATRITGDWKTSISTPDGDFEATMYIRQSTGGILSATVDVPGMDAYDIPLIFSFENDVVHYEVEDADYSFHGKLTDPSTIEGSSSQPNGTRSLVFKRVE